MPLFHYGVTTQVQRGDRLIIGLVNESVRFSRGEESLLRGNGDYWIGLTDGVQITTLAGLIADACGLSYREVDDEDDDGDFAVFEFI
mgnify:FL=1